MKTFIAVTGFPESGKSTIMKKISELYESVAICDSDEDLEQNWENRTEFLMDFLKKADKDINCFNVFFIKNPKRTNFVEIFQNTFIEAKIILIFLSTLHQKNHTKKSILEKFYNVTEDDYNLDISVGILRLHKSTLKNMSFLCYRNFDFSTLKEDLEFLLKSNAYTLKEYTYDQITGFDKFMKTPGLEKYNSETAQTIIKLSKDNQNAKLDVHKELLERGKKQLDKDLAEFIVPNPPQDTN
jgi:uridine kinase